MELRETLDPLNDLALEMPARVSALVQEGEALEKRVEALLETFDQKRSQARELFEQAEQALLVFKEQGEAQKEDLGSGMQETDQAFKAETAFLEHEKGFSDAGGEAGDAMDSLADAFGEAATAARQGQEQASAAIRDVAAAIETGRGDLTSALEAVAAESTSLAQAADDARNHLKERGDSLQQKMTDLLQRAQGRIGALIGRLDELQSAHEGVLERETSHLESRCDELVEGVRQRVEGEVTTMVTAAVSDVREALSAWSQEMEQAQQRAEGSRQQVDAGVVAVAEVTEPLPAAVESVRRAANEVGVSFG